MATAIGSNTGNDQSLTNGSSFPSQHVPISMVPSSSTASEGPITPLPSAGLDGEGRTAPMVSLYSAANLTRILGRTRH